MAALVMVVHEQHRDVETDAVQLDATSVSRCSWPSVEAMQKARVDVTNGRTAIDGGIRETDRRDVFTKRGFYVVRDVTLRPPTAEDLERIRKG